MRSPLAFLLGKTRLQKELRGLSLAPDIEPLGHRDVVLRGIPKGFEDQVSEIVLEVNPENRIVRLVMQGVDESSTDIVLGSERKRLIGDEGLPQASGRH